MKETEFKALISLLEDDDPNVESHIEAQLISMGREVIPRLEEAWETETYPEVQQKLEDIIHLIQSQDTIQGLKEWRETGGKDLLEGWMLVTKFQYPEMDRSVFDREFSRLSHKIWLEFRSSMQIADKLSKVNQILFESERFKSNRRSPFDPQNNFINTLIQSKKGSPFSLGILYMVICQQLELNIGGISLPGYFILTYPDSSPPLYIDIFNRGAFFHQKELVKFLAEHKIQEDPKYFRPNSHMMIILTLIKHLMECYQKRKKPEKAQELELLLKGLESD